MSIDMTDALYGAYEESCERATSQYESDMDDFKFDATYCVGRLRELTLSRKDLKEAAFIISALQELAEEYPALDLDDKALWKVIGDML